MHPNRPSVIIKRKPKGVILAAQRAGQDSQGEEDGEKDAGVVLPDSTSTKLEFTQRRRSSSLRKSSQEEPTSEDVSSSQDGASSADEADRVSCSSLQKITQTRTVQEAIEKLQIERSFPFLSSLGST